MNILKFLRNIIVFVATLWLKQLFDGKSRFYHFLSFNDACCKVEFSWATSHEWENIFKIFLKFQSKSEFGMRCLICEQTLGWDIWSRKCWFPTWETWHNANAHVAKRRNKWGGGGVRTLTMYATVGKKCQRDILQTHVHHVFMYLYTRLTTWWWTPLCMGL